jgi:hypothetical protein
MKTEVKTTIKFNVNILLRSRSVQFKWEWIQIDYITDPYIVLE